MKKYILRLIFYFFSIKNQILFFFLIFDCFKLTFYLDQTVISILKLSKFTNDLSFSAI
jgi:hypothetical protein